MYLSQAFAATFYSLCLLLIIASAVNAPTPDFLGDVAINCGSRSNSTGFDGREWIAETQVLEPEGKSTSSRIAKERQLSSSDPIPYMTARISAARFSYTFQVNPGQKFIRFHFHPSSYIGFEKSHDFFSVKVGHFTLLKNFSASLAADALPVNYLVKEFCLNVEQNEKLQITFSPYQSRKLRKTHAFINGIEIISMPSGLYFTPDGDLGASIVGQRNRYYSIDNSTALEMIQRLNIGGSSISQIEDFGMFRKWTNDAKYLLTSKLQPVNYFVRGIKFTRIPSFTAPLKIYQTSWRTCKTGRADKMHDFIWKVPVDVGFAYLVRLHFCNFELEMTEGGKKELNVLINNLIAEESVDIITLSGGIGVPIYRDYVVVEKEEKEAGKGDLLIALQSPDELSVGLLHGLEIFKLSGLGYNLASPNPLSMEQVSTFWNIKIQNLTLALGKKNAIMTRMTILIILLNIIVFKLREIWEKFSLEDKATQSASGRQSFRQFKLQEIMIATHNFSNDFLIGKGGFGVVYKGFIRGSSEIVAVKRLKSDSKQGAREFWAEIETLSKIRHIHLVSLIGYCNEYREMILVYEYMPRGTLADNLYKIGKNGKDFTPLTWEQRLKICIGAARGLDYLHTGIKYGVIHRDVKVSNILLDENLVAKISDFGLSKLGRLSESQSYISTKVKGTYGYLDPEYIMTHKATRKTDVYSFGVVMLVVLSGRQAVDRSIPWEPQSLVSLFRECLTNEDCNDIVDPSLQGNFSSDSLDEFIKTIENCLYPTPKKRPTMSQVVTSLEYILEKQQKTATESTKSDAAAMSVNSSQSCDDGGIVCVSPVHQERGDSFLDKAITRKVTQIPESQTRRVDFGSTRKPIWFWPWEALRKKFRNSKKKDLPLEDKLISQFSVSEMKQELASHGLVSISDVHNDLLSNDEVIPVSDVSEELWSEGGLISGFTISEIEEATDNFSNGRLIKENQAGRLFKGYVRRLGKQCAIHQFRGKVTDEKFVELSNEFQMLLQLRHQNLVPIIGCCYHKPSVYIIYEYISNTTLHHCLYHVPSRVPLSWIERIRICIDVAKGVQFLHNGEGKTIIHGYLRPDNILIQTKPGQWPEGRTLLPLWNLYSSRYNNQEKLNGLGLGDDYRPSEKLPHSLQEKYDVYSFGLVLLEVLFCQKPYINPHKLVNTVAVHMLCLKTRVRTGIRDGTVHRIIDSELRGRIVQKSVCEFLKIALTCLRFHPGKRPTMEYIIEKLELCLCLQENAEATTKQQIFNGKGENDDFNLENIYQQLSDFVAEEREMKY